MRGRLGRWQRRLRRKDHPWDPNFLVDVHSLPDERFVELCFRYFLDRRADPEGLRHFTGRLAEGMPRVELIKLLVTSEEYRDRLLGRMPLPRGQELLPNLRELHPERYTVLPLLDEVNKEALFYKADGPADFDWLEEAILEHGYYDKPGAWDLEANPDTERMAAIARQLGATRSLELGCANGLVVEMLRRAGVAAEGVEISHLAMAYTRREVREHIHFGDLLELDPAPGYDLIMGLDIFEHFNPNKLGRYLARCAELLAPGGRLWANIPAYGHDRVFGLVHEPMLAQWQEDIEAGRLFGLLHADAEGWPISGHLAWAGSAWWEAQFAAQGLARDEAAERAVHERFGQVMRELTPARLSFYVFVKP